MELAVAILAFALISIIGIACLKAFGFFVIMPGAFIMLFIFPMFFVGCPPNSYVFNENTGLTTYNQPQWKLPWETASTMPKSLDRIYNSMTIEMTSKSGINYTMNFHFKNLDFTDHGIRQFKITSQKSYEQLMINKVIKPAVQPIIDSWTPDYAHYTGVRHPDTVGDAIWNYLQSSHYKILFRQSSTATPHDLKFGYYVIGMAAYEFDKQYTCIDNAGYCNALNAANGGHSNTDQQYSTLDGDGDGYYDPFAYTQGMLPGMEKRY